MKIINPFYLYIIIIVFGTFLYSCNNQEKELPIINTTSLIADELTLSDIAEEVSYIKLDNSVLLSKIKDVKKIDNLYFISTKDDLYLFGIDGEYQHQIGKRGKGPFEYTRFNDFTLDVNSKLIYFLDYKKVIVFSFSGEYKYSFPTPESFEFSSVYFFNNCLYFPVGFHLGDLEKEWIVTDINGNIKREKNNFISGISPTIDYKIKPLFESNSRLYYWNEINDTIFRIDEKCEATYLFANGNFRVTGNDLSSPENYMNKISWQLMSVLGTEHFLIFDYLLLKDKQRVYTFFNKNNQKMYKWAVLDNFKSDGVNTYDNGLVFIPKSQAQLGNKEYLVSWAEAYDIKALVTREIFKSSIPKYPEKKKALDTLANNLDENDNPVLILVKLKE